MSAARWSPTDSAYQARLLRAHEQMRSHSALRAEGALREDVELRAADAPVREAVLASWRRTLSALPGRAAADGAGRAVLEGDELARARQAHLFSAVLPLLRSRLIEPAVEAGLMVALGDAQGRLLWVEGRPQLISRADAMGFAEGADWSEAAMGTSAPALALATTSSMQVVGAEHFHEAVHPWSCSAVPVRHPTTREVLGVLDVTGGAEAVSPLVLPLLEATARAVREEIAALTRPGAGAPQSAEGPRPAAEPRSAGEPGPTGAPGRRRPRILPSPAPAPSELLLTGRRTALLRHGSGTLELSPRHAELLTVLHLREDGISGAELAEAVHGDRAAEGTVRAEVVRLRKLLTAAALELAGRPYRLFGTLDSDLRRARAALAEGDVEGALSAYAGPLLPGSEAPAIVHLREGMDAHLRELLLERGTSAQLWRYAQRPEASADLEVLMTLLEVAPADAPERAGAAARARALRGELG